MRDEGLRIRRAAPLALSAFLASAAGALDLSDDTLTNVVVVEDVHVADFRASWSSLHSVPLPEFPSFAKQSVWENQPPSQTRPL